MHVLVIDVGGTHVKVLASGQDQAREFVSGPTLTPKRMVSKVRQLVTDWKYDVVSIGYPGPVLRNRPISEPWNLGKGWIGFNFEAAFKRPTKVVNDAAMQALGSYRRGKMLFLGLGTGLGSAVIVNGIVEPMELGHLPYKKATFEDYVGVRGLEKYGKNKWRRYVADVVERLIAALEPDDVVLGGGNIHRLKKLPPRCRAGDNINAFRGGFRLWDNAYRAKLAPPYIGKEAGQTPDGRTRGFTNMEEDIVNTLSWNEQQLQKMRAQPGFIAALDQSGGSTPKALAAYGIKAGAWSNEDEMFAIVHQMRTRIMASPNFTGERILGAILFENTMDRDIQGQSTADYLWNVKRVVPFLKVDKGLADEQDGVRLMKPMPQLAPLLNKAKAKRIFGTKMRSFIKQANAAGIRAIVNQQFAVGAQILAAGLVPILEPEVDIHCPEKARAEELLKAAVLEKLNKLPAGRLVFVKLTLPEQDDFYTDLVRHLNVVKVLALSGGYSREEANERLRRNHGVVASFSRALLEGLSAPQSDSEFNAVLAASIQSIFEASTVRQPGWQQGRELKAA